MRPNRSARSRHAAQHALGRADARVALPQRLAVEQLGAAARRRAQTHRAEHGRQRLFAAAAATTRRRAGAAG